MNITIQEMSAAVKFCPGCNNLLNPKETKDALTYVCRSCSYGEKATNAAELVVHRRDVHHLQKEKLHVPADVIHDPTLSRTENFRCEHCPNSAAVFWQLPEAQQEDAMALIFVCTACCQWRLEGKQ